MEEVLVCRKCKKEMEIVRGGDFLSYLSPSSFYCNNEKCSKYGYLTAVGIKKQIKSKLKEEK